MLKSRIDYLSNMRRVLLFFFSTSHIEKNVRNIHWTCLNVQLYYVPWMYFLFLHIKIKTLQKIIQFSCFRYTSASFQAAVKRIL